MDPTEAPPPARMEHRPGDTILAIDDDDAQLELYRMSLEDQGYVVETAISGVQGIVLARSVHPHLILLDMMMPGTNGIGVCRALRQRLETRAIPIIFVSAVTDGRQKVLGLEAGGDDYIVKPFELEELFARVLVALRRSRPAEEMPHATVT